MHRRRRSSPPCQATGTGHCGERRRTVPESAWSRQPRWGRHTCAPPHDPPGGRDPWRAEGHLCHRRHRPWLRLPCALARRRRARARMRNMPHGTNGWLRSHTGRTTRPPVAAPLPTTDAVPIGRVAARPWPQRRETKGAAGPPGHWLLRQHRRRRGIRHAARCRCGRRSARVASQRRGRSGGTPAWLGRRRAAPGPWRRHATCALADAKQAPRAAS